MSRKTARRLLPGARTVLGAVLALCAATAGCAVAGTGSDGPIKIGGTLGFTGSLAAPSAEYQAIYRVWADGVNARGGLLGRKVEMDIKNDSSAAATATTQYQTLLTRDRVDLLLAPYATFVGAAVLPLVRSSGKLLFNGGFTDTGLNNAAGGQMLSVYPYQPSDYTRGLFAAIAGLPAASRPTTVGILTNNNPFTLEVRDGTDGVGGARRFARTAGMNVVFDETYGSDTTDFTGAITKAKASGARLFLVLGLPEDSGTILKAIRALDYTPGLVCACGSQVSTLSNWPDLGPATEGVVSTTGSWPTQRYPGMDVLQGYAASRGERVISLYAAVAYASLQVIEQAVNGAGSLDQAKLKQYVYGHSFATVVGPITFEPNGTASFRQVLVQTVRGAVTPVWPADVARAGLRTNDQLR
jgi:branched-chain amino acid transport system substrate-binding protein